MDDEGNYVNDYWLNDAPCPLSPLPAPSVFGVGEDLMTSIEGEVAFGNSSESEADEDDLIRDEPAPGDKSVRLDGETEAVVLDESFSDLSNEAGFEDEQRHVRRSLKRFSFGVSPAASPLKSPTKKKDVATTLKDMLRAPGRIDLNDLSDPLLAKSPPKKKKGNETVQDEFFGVYCLISRSSLKQYKNRCYIGYTVDPNRRIRQHNAGKQFGGAGKTDNRGPWDMVCITHGFPNSISALRFEWAWQNPQKSKRLKHLSLKKSPKESPFAFRLRVLCHMLSSDPWQRLDLTFRWILPECEIPFPSGFDLPPQLRKAYGVVEKANTVIPPLLKDYTTVEECHLCQQKIAKMSHLLRCPLHEVCRAHYHSRCLAEHVLKEQGEFEHRLFPVSGKCPKCRRSFLWGELVRDQRTLLSVEDAKPDHEGQRIAEGLIPLKIVKV